MYLFQISAMVFMHTIKNYLISILEYLEQCKYISFGKVLSIYTDYNLWKQISHWKPKKSYAMINCES